MDLEPAFLEFKTHGEAFEALSRCGFQGLERCPLFKAAELVQAINKILEHDEITVMDLTGTIPETPQAAYKALTVAAFTAASSCRKDSKAAFVVVRTRANTPSFLFGVHWNMTQVFGREVAETRMRASDTPFIYVFQGERQICIPSSVCATDALLASRLVAQQLSGRTELFACALCATSLSRLRGDQVEVEEVAVTPCGHMFRRECAMEKIEEGMYNCPVCGASVHEEGEAGEEGGEAGEGGEGGEAGEAGGEAVDGESATLV